MIVVMYPDASEEQLERVLDEVRAMDLDPRVMRGTERRVVALIGDVRNRPVESIALLPGVEKLVPISQPYKLVSREAGLPGAKTVVRIPSPGGKGESVEIGGDRVVVMAGPCAVESLESLLECAERVKEAGGKVLRGGAYKPRTSPYSFQGLEEQGLQMLAEARERTGLLVVTEVLDSETARVAAEYADILQIGSRNMFNFNLLKAVGRFGKPVLLKRGFSSTIQEWLLAAEYIVGEGNPRVILCERGIRTFETYTRNTLDISAVLAVRELSHLPVIVDPSHAAGRWEMVNPLAKASIAAGADGLLIEVHPNPKLALCDGAQSLTPANFKSLMAELAPLAQLTGRSI